MTGKKKSQEYVEQNSSHCIKSVIQHQNLGMHSLQIAENPTAVIGRDEREHQVCRPRGRN